MKIKSVNHSDRKAVAEYLVSYWKSRGMKQYKLSWALKYLEKGHTYEITDDRFFVAKDSKKVLGTIALVKYAGDVAEIRDEAWKSDAIGSALLAHLIAYAKTQKIRKIYSLALKSKTDFYRKHGFKKEGVLKNHFRKGESLAIMSRFL